MTSYGTRVKLVDPLTRKQFEKRRTILELRSLAWCPANIEEKIMEESLTEKQQDFRNEIDDRLQRQYLRDKFFETIMTSH